MRVIAFFFPNFGLKQLWTERSRQKVINVAVVFKTATFITYFRSIYVTLALSNISYCRESN